MPVVEPVKPFRMLMRKEVPVGFGHGRQELWHAHLDIKGETPLSEAECRILLSMKEEIRKDFGLLVDDQPFCRLRPEQYAEVERRASRDIAELLADSELYGAPLAHWTLKTGHADFTGRSSVFHDAFIRIAEMAEDLNRPAYVEVERVRRIVFPASPTASVARSGSLPSFSVSPFELVALKDIGREFRDTEVHVTVEKLEEADPQVFAELFQRLGFRIAYRDRTDGGVSIVATAQGFEPDISRLFLASLDWTQACQASGYVRCDVTVKKEDIAWHRVMNDPYVLPVILPGSLRFLS